MNETELKASHARSVVNCGHVRVAEETAHVGRPRAQGAVKSEAKIELIREAGIVRGVEVICGCGERVRIRFDYE